MTDKLEAIRARNDREKDYALWEFDVYSLEQLQKDRNELLRVMPLYEQLHKQAISRTATDGVCFGCGNHEGHADWCPMAALDQLQERGDD